MSSCSGLFWAENMESSNQPKHHRVSGEDSQKALRFLYRTAPGRVLLKVAVRPGISRFGGRILGSRLSAVKIRGFIKKNGIDMAEYEQRKFRSFNDFFTRKILPEKRAVDMEPRHLVSPCDSKLSAYPVDENSVFRIKGCDYTVEKLLENRALAGEFSGGYCLIFRLCVDDYHRYCYIDNAVKGANIHINGELNTVQPLVLEHRDIYARNAREYTVMETENFGRVAQVEVGALMVGKITNHHAACAIKKGEEKGLFEFGGSTIVLLVSKDRVRLDEGILESAAAGFEVVVKMGEKIGEAI